MKRMYYILIVVLILGIALFVNYSNAPSSDPDRTGYILKKEVNKILVVDAEPQTVGSHDDFYGAFWFSNVTENVEIGDKVNVWYGSDINDSYPAQAAAEHVEVLKSFKPEGANLSESEALYKALRSPILNDSGVTAVVLIEYDKVSEIWNIKLKEMVLDEKEFDIEVND